MGSGRRAPSGVQLGRAHGRRTVAPHEAKAVEAGGLAEAGNGGQVHGGRQVGRKHERVAPQVKREVAHARQEGPHNNDAHAAPCKDTQVSRRAGRPGEQGRQEGSGALSGWWPKRRWCGGYLAMISGG